MKWLNTCVSDGPRFHFHTGISREMDKTTQNEINKIDDVQFPVDMQKDDQIFRKYEILF